MKSHYYNILLLNYKKMSGETSKRKRDSKYLKLFSNWKVLQNIFMLTTGFYVILFKIIHTLHIEAIKKLTFPCM